MQKYFYKEVCLAPIQQPQLSSQTDIGSGIKRQGDPLPTDRNYSRFYSIV